MTEKPYYTPDPGPSLDGTEIKIRERSWIFIALIVICLHTILPWLGTLTSSPLKKPPRQKLLIQTVRLPPSSPKLLIGQAKKPLIHQTPPAKSAPEPLSPPSASPPTAPEPPPPEAPPPKEEAKPLKAASPPEPKKETPKAPPKPVQKKAAPPPPKPAPKIEKKAAPVTKPVGKAPEKKSEENKAKLAAQEAEKKKQQEAKAAQETERKQREQKEQVAKEAEKKRQIEKAEAERKQQAELAAREAARKQTLLAKAQENLAKNRESRDKDLSASTLNLQNTAIPTLIGSLQIDALPLEAEGLAKWTATEVSYRDEVAQILQGALRLPEYGSIKVELTINKAGKVDKIKILSSESSKNKQYIEQKIPGLHFPPFGNRFQETECTFSITLKNERASS